MLNKQPLAVGQVYFSQPAHLEQALQSPETPYVIDYHHPKILPFMSGWDNLLLPKQVASETIQVLVEQHLKRSKLTAGSQLQPIDQFWVQFIRGLAGHQQLFILVDFLDQLAPAIARQLLADLKEITKTYALVVIMTTEQEAVFKNFGELA